MMKLKHLGMAVCALVLLFGMSFTNAHTLEAQLPAADHAFVNVNVIDVVEGNIVPGQVVLVRDGHIIAQVPFDATLVLDGIEVIDGKNRYLIPGLMDMHAHPGTPGDLDVLLANGVTTIRVMWGDDKALKTRQAVEQDQLIAPNLLVAGRIVDGDPAIQYPTIALGDPADAERTVAEQAEAGYDLVKIYSNMSLDVFDAVMGSARRHGIEVSGHLPQAVPFAHAVESGMTTMEHFVEIAGDVLEPPAESSIDLAVVFPQVGELVMAAGRGEIDLEAWADEGRIAELASVTTNSDVWLVPTLVAMRNFTTHPNEGNGDWDPFLSPMVHAYWSRAWKARQDNWPLEIKKGEDQVYALRLRILEAMHRAGAKVMVGTDAAVPGVYYGFSVIDEIKALAGAGFSKAEALQAATLVPGRYLARHRLGQDGDRGIIREGAVADLVLLEKNPLEDLEALRSVAGVMKNGHWLPASQLNAKLEQVAAHYTALDSRFAGAPTWGQAEELPPPSSPLQTVTEDDSPHSTFPPGAGVADFVRSDGAAMRLRSSSSGTTRNTNVAYRPADGNWQEWRINQSPGELRIERKGHQPLRAQQSDRVVQLVAGDLVLDEISDAAGEAIILSGTPADVLVLNAIIDQFKHGGDSLELVAWHCGMELDCEDKTAVRAVIRRNGFEIVEFQGTQAYSLNVQDGGGAYNARYWVGDGPLYSGEAIMFKDSTLAEWQRIR